MRILTIFACIWTFLLATVLSAPAAELSPLEALGKQIFFDTSLSANGTQACASCHAAEAGFTGPDAAVNADGAVYQGALPNRFGNRKPPAAAYAGENPLLAQDSSGNWFGGMFWDGRATGAVLGDPLAEQARGPFLNPLEHGLANAQVLCAKVRQSNYSDLFEEVWGTGALDCAKDVNGVYEKIARSVAAYERSGEVNSYTSKFDLFWDTANAVGRDITKIKCGTGGMGGMGGMGCPGGGSNGWASYRNLGLTDAELQGLAVFNDPSRGNCAACHAFTVGTAGYPLFTDFGYDNLGLPKNPRNPFYTMPPAWNPDGENWIDDGLGGFLRSAGKSPEIYSAEIGKHKVPSLRNVDLRPAPDFVKAYGHNGYFKSLEEIVFFYHWRAMMNRGMGGGMGGMETMFPPPEVDQNLATLGMFPRPQVENVVLFLKTLSDGYYLK